MTIQDLFLATYHSQRHISTRRVTHIVADTIIECALPGKELAAKKLVEKNIGEMIQSEQEFIRTYSKIFLDLEIDITKFANTSQPADEAIKQLEQYAIHKGFFYEQVYRLARGLGLFFQTHLHIESGFADKNAPSVIEALLLLNDEIISLLPVLTGENSKALIVELKFIIENPSKYTDRQIDFFVNKICSSLFLPTNSTNINPTNSINVSGNISGSTIIIGNDNKVETSTNQE